MTLIKHPRDFFKNLRESSYQEYGSVPALNWGETIDGKYVMTNRYYFNWSRPDLNNKLHPLTIGIEEYIIDYLKKVNEKRKKLSVFIGVDSQNKLLKTTFVCAIVLYTEKSGGHELITKINLNKIYDYRYRLLREADILAEIARNLCPFLKKSNIEYELHLDYNSGTNHKSNGVVTEVMNYFKHLRYEPKIKPQAWAASYAADYFCR